MKWNGWIRQFHRWISVVFTLAVVTNLIQIVRGEYSTSLGLLAVGPLFLLLPSGLYMFMLPYVARWRYRQGTAERKA